MCTDKFPTEMSCDSDKLRRVASRRLITDNSMAPSHNKIPKYVFGTPPNILGNPLRSTESTLLPTWQQTYTLQCSDCSSAHTPSHTSPYISLTTGIFQCNSTPAPPKSQTKKRPNNENPNTPVPKRARKTGSSAKDRLPIEN